MGRNLDKLRDINGVILRKGFNPNARRSFGNKHNPSKDRLPTSVQGKSLFGGKTKLDKEMDEVIDGVHEAKKDMNDVISGIQRLINKYKDKGNLPESEEDNFDNLIESYYNGLNGHEVDDNTFFGHEFTEDEVKAHPLYGELVREVKKAAALGEVAKKLFIKFGETDID